MFIGKLVGKPERHISPKYHSIAAIVSFLANKHLPHCLVILARGKTSAKELIMPKQRRWLTAAIETSKTTDLTMPWQRGAKVRPAAFKHIQILVAPRPKAVAAR